MINYVENTMEYTEKSPRKVAETKSHKKRSTVFLYTSNDQLEIVSF